ncbi:MAG: hypothetical protein GX786_08700 [Clostridiales bacterium]|nr:hypothetical protein [Clostridiales bacterium]
MADKMLNRILQKAGDEKLLERLLRLPPADVNTLLLAVFEKRGEITEPKDVVKKYQNNRFVLPRESPPLKYFETVQRLLALAQKANIQGKLLSPAAPLGSCSAFGCVSQNNVVAALRGTEMLSDPTNMLAIMMAAELKEKKKDNQLPLHYCSAAQVVRAQKFPEKPGVYNHFGLFGMVSSGTDRGSYRCEKEMLSKQIQYYQNVFSKEYGQQLFLTVSKRGGYTDGKGFWEYLVAFIKEEFPLIPLTLDTSQQENAYYQGLNFKMYTKSAGRYIEVGDGGFVDWISQMTGNKKQRCLISALGIDRLLPYITEKKETRK